MWSGLIDTALIAASSTVMVLGFIAATAGLVLGIRALVRRIKGGRLHWPTGIKAWNARQWMWACIAVLVVLFTWVMPFAVSRVTEYCYWDEDTSSIPENRYIIHVLPTGEYVDGPYDRTGGFSHDTVSDPCNPWWVKFYHQNDLIPVLGIVTLLYCSHRHQKAGPPQAEHDATGFAD